MIMIKLKYFITHRFEVQKSLLLMIKPSLMSTNEI